jgi:hypothetical protein
MFSEASLGDRVFLAAAPVSSGVGFLRSFKNQKRCVIVDAGVPETIHGVSL